MTVNRTWMRRVATVGVLLSVCTVAGATSAAAASSQPAQDDLLGLNALVSGVTGALVSDEETGLVGGVTAALTGPQKTSAARPAGTTTTAVRTDDGLSGTVKKLPLLGGLLGSVVEELPLVGSSDKPAAPAPAPVPAPAKPAVPKPVAPAPATGSGGKAESVQKPAGRPGMSPVGSTWTAPRNAGTVEPSGGSGGFVGAAGDVVRNISSVLPDDAAGKAGVGAAAVALIVLGGIAVAGAAGAAGAAGRRTLVGGAW